MLARLVDRWCLQPIANRYRVYRLRPAMTDCFEPHVERLEDRRLLVAVASMTPAPGSTVAATPTEIVIGFDETVDPVTLTEDSFSVTRSGGDGTFGDGNEVVVPGRVIAGQDGRSATFDSSLAQPREVGGANPTMWWSMTVWPTSQTTWDDVEFAPRDGSHELAGMPGTSAASRADLLTAVLHELGHVLGSDHCDDGGVMDESLPLGTRRVWDDDSLLGDALDLSEVLDASGRSADRGMYSTSGHIQSPPSLNS
jgi:hypothetical protein